MPLAFTRVPPLGSNELLAGRAHVAFPANYVTATYIKVLNLWYTKPFYAAPTVALSSDGTFEVDITTGPNDESASQIVTYLLPSNYPVPLVGGQPGLPLDLDNAAVGKASVVR